MDSFDDRIYSTLRHELGNSVNSLTITLEVLLKNYEYFNDETKIEFISKSLEQVNRQYKILECLRIYQSADIGDLTRVELPEFLADWVAILRDKIPKGKIKVQTQINNQDAAIRVDRNALAQSLYDIAENAFDTLTEHAQPEIMVSYSLNKKNAEITIVDNGEGMNRDILSRAGVPLFTTKTNRKGLGLSIAEKLICKMGGTLEITSKKSQGTSVKVSFPTYAQRLGSKQPCLNISEGL